MLQEKRRGTNDEKHHYKWEIGTRLTRIGENDGQQLGRVKPAECYTTIRRIKPVDGII